MKKVLCITLSCTIFVFSVFFLPSRKANAELVLLGIGLAAAIAVGLVCYGVAVESTNEGESEALDRACDVVMDTFDGSTKNEIMSQFMADWSLFWLTVGDAAATLFAEGYVSNVATEGGYFSTSSALFLDGSGFTTNMKDLATYLSSDAACNPCYTNPNYSGSSYYNNGTSLKFSAYSDADISIVLCADKLVFIHTLGTNTWNTLRAYYTDYFTTTDSLQGGTALPGHPGYYYKSISGDVSHWQQFFRANAIPITLSTQNWSDIIGSIDLDNTTPISADLNIGATSCVPAAQDVFDATGSLDSYKIDPLTGDYIDFGNVLTQTGCDTYQDVITGVRDGVISPSDVMDSLDAVPYVLTDVDTGEIATSDTPAEKTKAVPLTDTLAIPADIAAADTYTPVSTADDTGDTTVSTGTTYAFPISKFFPFCLPFDIYDFLVFFQAEPKTPVFTVDFAPIVSKIPLIYDKTKDYTFTIDLSGFDTLAQIVRIMETIGAIVGLAVVSRRLIHGGD